MSGEKQSHIPKNAIPGMNEIINDAARHLKIPKPALIRMINTLEDASTYEARLNKELDGEETLNSISEEIKRKGFIGGKQVG